jgi:hypothetical protein
MNMFYANLRSWLTHLKYKVLFFYRRVRYNTRPFFDQDITLEHYYPLDKDFDVDTDVRDLFCQVRFRNVVRIVDRGCICKTYRYPNSVSYKINEVKFNL